MRNHKHEEVLKRLYKQWPQIRAFLKGVGCDKLNAEDIFQEALLIYIRKTETVDFQLTVDHYFYLRNTCKLLWYNQARKQSKQGTTVLDSDVEALNDDWMNKELKLQSIEVALKQLGNQCRELLELFYGLGMSMVDIAIKLGLRNDKVAKAQKYRCLQKAKELVNHDSIESYNIER
jgi:RNA polymerase sigma factor (sigma-70 family)